MQGSCLEHGTSSNNGDNGQRLEVTVGGDEGSPRLDRVLAVLRPELSRSRLKALILAGSVTARAPPSATPLIMSRPAIRSRSTSRAVAPEPKGEDIALDIVFEDEDIIVIDKPKGLVVHPAAGHESGTLVNALIAHCGASLSGIGGVRRPGIVHRLDKDTTGLMVVAKNDRAHQSLTAQFADHGRTGPMQRGYMAFIWGVPNRPRGTSMRRSTVIPLPAKKWRCAPAAARRSPIGNCRRRFRDGRQAGRVGSGLPARDRADPSDPGAPVPYRPPPAWR